MQSLYPKNIFLNSVITALFSFSSLAAYTQVDLNLGLVAYYPFNGNALDATGRGNNPISNNATLTSDRNGTSNSAYSFNGLNQYIQIPNSDDFNQDSSMSISYQFLTQATNLQAIIGKIQYTGATGTQFNTGINFKNFPGVYYGVNPSGGNCAGLAISNSQVYSNSQVPLSEWTCVTVTFDRGIQKIYLNGEIRQITNSGFAKMLKCTNATVQIGTWWSGDPQWFNGKIDEIRIYNRAINEDEVKALSPCSGIGCSSWLKNNIISSAVRTGDIDVTGNKLTVEAEFNWTEPSKFINDGGDIVSKHTNPSDANYVLRPLRGSITTTNGYFLTGNVCEIEYNKTYHVAMVYDGSTLKYYRNGFLLSSVPCSGNLVTNNLITTIGNYAQSPTNQLEDFYGYINNVRIWNVARTQDEIKEFMSNTLPNPTSQTGLLANYVFDNLLNKQGNTAFNGSLFGFAAINATNPQCTFTADSCKTNPCTLTITATKDTTICKGNSVELNANGAVTYKWNASPYLSNINIANPIANPPVTTSFIVTGTDALGCVDTDTVVVTVRNLPVVIASSDTAICGSGTVQLSVSPATGGSYSWTPSAGLNNTTISNPKATINSTAEYFVTYTDANGCKNLDSVTITVNTIPTISTRSDTSICSGASLTLTTTGTGNSFSWTPSTGLSSSNIKSPVAKPSITTKYIVTTTTAEGCTNKDSVIISVLETPQINATGDTAICGSSSVQLNANASGAISYSWSPSTGLSNPNISNPLANPDATTKYLVTATSANGCKNTDSVLVKIFPAPQFSVVPPGALLCEGKSVTLTASGGNNYTWYGDTTLTATNGAVTSATPAVSTIYSVIIEEEKCQITDTLFVDVTVLSAPIAAAEKSNDITCNVLETQLTATGGLRFSWTPASTLNNSAIANPIANPTETTLYTVKVTSETGCTDIDTITVYASGGDASKTFFVPNAFSPNGDGLNDCFGLQKWGNVVIKEFAIYNKWGNKVFYTNDINQCWNGVYEKIAQPSGVYVYYILAESPICGPFTRKGTIVLVR